MKFLCVIGCLVLLPLYGQWTQPTVVEQVTVINTPPRYRLLDGIKVAIENVTFKSKEVNVANVMEELESMQSVHDVSLPYRYTKSSTTGKNSKGWLKGENKKKRMEVESMVSKMIALNGGEACMKASAPVPNDYEGRDAFISAYVEYRLNPATEADLAKYNGRIGGEKNCLRREARANAMKLWAGRKSTKKR